MPAPLQFLNELRIRQFMTMGGYTVLTYDYFLTLDLEVDYIWHAPWTPVKIVFLLNRYGTLMGQCFIMFEELGILSHGSRKFCAKFLWFQSLLVFVSSETSRTLLLLRAWALWRCSYHVAFSLVSIYVFYVVMRSIYSTYLMLKYDLNFEFPYLDETGVCDISATVANVWLSGFITFLLDTGMSAVIAYYLYKLWKGPRQLRHSSLLRLLVRDAILFYTVSIFHDVLGILALSVFMEDPLYLVQVALSFPLLVVTGQRAVLNLRGFRARFYTTQDIDRSVDRQISAMRHRSFWQTVDPWMNDLHRELELREGELTRNRATGLRFTDEESSHELEVIRNPIGPSASPCESARPPASISVT